MATALSDADLDGIRSLAKEFLTRELAPRVQELDDKEEFPLDVYARFLKTGLPLLHLPEEFGGANSFRGLTLVGEEMARVDPGFALSVLASSQLFGFNLHHLGTPEQKRRYLGGLSQGKLGCWALTEPDHGSDAVGIRTRAVRKGADYVLDGAKTFITNAPIADYFIVLAREFGEGIEGGTAFVLERGHPGLDVGKPLKKLGNRTSPTGEVFLNSCKVPASQVLGQPGRAFFDMKHSLDLERVVFVGPALGIVKECLSRVLSYVQTRKQFGRPIAEYQLVQEAIADMAVREEMLSAYMDRIFGLIDEGKPIHYEAAVLKYYGADRCLEVADRAVQLFGGNGYMREYGVEKFWRDARLYPIGGGTSEMNKLIVAKHLLKRSRA